MSQDASPESVSIIGAGIGGLASAILLARHGYQVAVYERRPKPSTVNTPSGRSINFTLSTRGAVVLQKLNLLDEVLKNAVPLRGRVLHLRSGKTSFHPYGNKEHEVLYAINRAELTQILVRTALSYPNIQIFFDSKCVDLDKNTSTVTLATEQGPLKAKSHFIIGADGAYSAVKTLMLRDMNIEPKQEYSEWGYKEFIIPTKPPTPGPLAKNALHLWSRTDALMCAIPNSDSSFVCTLILKLKGPNGFESIQTIEQVQKFMTQRFPDLLELLPNATRDWLNHPANLIVTTQASNWYYRDSVVMVGDACHAVSPFLGQGMNAALQDSLTLFNCITKFPHDREQAFKEYQNIRLPEARALGFLSQKHLETLKTNLESPIELAKVRSDLFLNRLYPKYWKPFYTLVAHTTQPYQSAISRSRFQKRMGWILGAPILTGVFYLTETISRHSNDRKKRLKRIFSK